MKVIGINKKELIKFIESKDWIVWVNGRSTDYIDEFCEEDSIKNLINKIKGK